MERTLPMGGYEEAGIFSPPCVERCLDTGLQKAFAFRGHCRNPFASYPSSNIFSRPFFSTPDSSLGGAAGTLTQGSGFFISADGFVLTNYHLIRDAGRGDIFVKLQDERQFSAQLIGSDEPTDIAVLKIKSADSDKVRIGQFAFALGAPYDLPQTFTFGVVDRWRMWMDESLG